jgi:hypothetical protein
MGDFGPIAQQGGFALLAAVCVWAIVAVVKIGVILMERSHLREIEGLRMLASDRADMMKQSVDVMLEVRSALVNLQDEISGLSNNLREKSG